MGETVQVTYSGRTTTVALSQPTPVTFEGTLHARLSEVVALALPGQAQSALEADFQASDGFRASMKSNCQGVVPVAGTVFTEGYIDINTRKLRWDTSLMYPGCLYVKDLAEILLSEK
jgi:hypothetical protein